MVSLCCRPIASHSVVPTHAPSSHSGLFLRQGRRTSWPCRDSGRGAALCTVEWGLRPRSVAVPSPFIEYCFHSITGTRGDCPADSSPLNPALHSRNTLFPVVPAWLFHSHSTAQQAANPWLTLSLCSHDTNAALGPPQAPRHGQSGTLSLHCVGSSPLPVWRVFVVACVHSTEHVAHGAVSTTSRGWPLSCANAGQADIRALIVPLAL